MRDRRDRVAARATTSSGSPSRSAPSTNVDCARPARRSASGSPPRATSATAAARRARRSARAARGRSRRPRPRSAFGAGRVGAARGERDDGAERVRGPDQRADVPGIGDVPEREPDRPLLERPAGRRGGRRRSPAAGARASRPPASSSGSTSSPATSRSTGSIPAARAASTRSSPSQTNSPSLSRCRRLCEPADELQARVRGRRDHAGSSRPSGASAY